MTGLRGSDAFRAMLGGARVRRRAWPSGAYWAADLEDERCRPIIVGPPAWVRRCYDDDRWCGHQWRGRDWEVMG